MRVHIYEYFGTKRLPSDTEDISHRIKMETSKELLLFIDKLIEMYIAEQSLVKQHIFLHDQFHFNRP